MTGIDSHSPEEREIIALVRRFVDSDVKPAVQELEHATTCGCRGAARVPLLALVETACGVSAAAELAAVDGVVRLGFGHLDLAADLGADPDDPLIAHCRHELLLAAGAAATAPPVDGVTPVFRDRELVADAFEPTTDEIAWAYRVRAATRDGVAVVDGAMVDAPVLARARSVLARVEGAR